MDLFIGCLSSYLLGSIPTAYIFGKLYKRIDIREHGSGNVGATNVFRVLGKWPGIIVLALDVLKGALAVTAVANATGNVDVSARLVLSICVVAGHNWTVFLKFKGGKGIATTLGILIGLAIEIATIRPVLIGTVCVWLACFLITAIVSISSIVAAVALPITMAMTDQPFKLILVGVLFCLFVVFRHKPNIRRLLRGEEPKVPLPFHKKNPS